MWRIFQAVVATGTTYVFAPDTTEGDARAYWLGPGIASWVLEVDDGASVAGVAGVAGSAGVAGVAQIAGMYKMIPNRRDLGSHVGNASVMIAPPAHGRGYGEALGRHCLREAKRAGYLSMQFNFVVSTNTGAVRLWQKLGFAIAGTLPKAFRHRELGLVDAFVMYRFLDDISVE
jgi:GNAT superfamily N-acetyltransferase